MPQATFSTRSCTVFSSSFEHLRRRSSKKVTCPLAPLVHLIFRRQRLILTPTRTIFSGGCSINKSAVVVTIIHNYQSRAQKFDMLAYRYLPGFAPPIVGSWYSKNSSLTKRTTRHDLPTAVSPSNTSLKWQTLPVVMLAVSQCSRLRSRAKFALVSKLL